MLKSHWPDCPLVIGENETEKLIVEADTPTLLNMVKAAWQQHQRVTVAGSMNERGKLMSMQPAIPWLLLQQGGADAVECEARTSLP